MNLFKTMGTLLQTGLGSLAAYLAAHVLLCLVPAFFIAGALITLIPKEAITRYLGKDTRKWISYPAAALGGFILAVCSCTIMPLFASIHKKGAGLGPAITFLFVGPAVNILAISFTGVQIGMDIALARIVLSLIFGVLIGLLIAWIFRKDEKMRADMNSELFGEKAVVPGKNILFFVLLLAVLVSGTLQVGFLTNTLFAFDTSAQWGTSCQATLDTLVPPNTALGIEGVSIHGVLLIGLLVLISGSAIKGLKHVDEGFNAWTYSALAIISMTLLTASMKISIIDSRLSIGVTGRFLTEAVLISAVWITAKQAFNKAELSMWLWETWRFVKQIFPLLLMGVFTAGMARALIPGDWIERIAGSNTVWANLISVLFGVFMYFPTLVEVPVAQAFLSLGMHRGPLLAYLLADPELSLQSILITSSVIGKKKTAVYVILVTIFSTLSGLLFGWFIK
ncbi:MAG: permease [Anaerolineaceae bacterium]|nr:permease [Anaerolineaceae bacterium]